ncbi:serine hydrolase [Aliikangiella marina]|uniref:Serine hydrolase n=1 Tax=Aliikangiella marina TaxID=1712262 RepID=A0A545T139_9GAMM|nr:serine hydrolase [Aliikangiella marina]TQV70909.1 serine hydrolase [Aliikangiella marina]
MLFKIPLRQLSIWLALSLFSFSLQSNEINVDGLDEVYTKIDKYLSSATEKGFSGAVLIAKDGKIIVNQGYGFADRLRKITNTPETVIDVGSVTKQFTATAILKLEEMGKLTVSDPIKLYFHDLPRDKQKITIHQLLTHASGLVGGIGKGDFDHIPTDTYFTRLFSTQLLHPPGSKHYYSNAGYSVLARIIELVSDQEYEAFIQEHLFKPAGMKNTGYLLVDWNKLPQAKGYQYSVFDIGSMVKRYQHDKKISWVLKGNGGFNSTQEDMYRWYLALINHRVITEKSFAKLTQGYIDEYDDGDSQYAYGWAVFQSPRNTKVVAHNGSNGTFFYDFVMFPEEATVILFATNSLTRPQYRIANTLESILFKPDYEVTALQADPLAQILLDAIKYQGDFDRLPNIIKTKYADSIKRKHYLNRLGIALQNNNYLNQAVALFRLNVELFDNDGNLWDSLGEAYLAQNNYQLAIKSFERALELKPESDCYWCDNSAAKLKKSKAHLDGQ